MAKLDINPQEINLQNRYEKYADDRRVYLDRAEDCALLTIPTLVPPENHNRYTKYPTPYQGVGARGVNNLSSKLLLALLPPNTPFFRFYISEEVQAEMPPEIATEANRVLARIEKLITQHIETNSFRPSLFLALKHLLVAGNCLLHLPKDGGVTLYPLARYVVKRDPVGNVLEIIALDNVSAKTLDDTVISACQIDEPTADTTDDDSVEVYTYVGINGDTWQTWQEINKLVVPGSEGTFKKDKSPWIALRFSKIDGENYSRSYVEEFLGDLNSLESLSKAIIQGSLAAAKVVFMVKPNGHTKISNLSKAENGGYVNGMPDDVIPLQLNKYADFRVAKEMITEINQRLAHSFLLNSAIQRDAERVTALEIRYMAGELEDALGGFYSILSQELQLPLVTRIMHELTRRKTLPELPPDQISPTIVTGLEALGREHELQKLTIAVQQLQVLGPELMMRYLKPGVFIQQVFTALGVETEGLIKSDQEIQQEEQQAQQLQMAQQLAGPAVNQLGGMAKQAMANQQAQQQQQQQEE